MLRNSYMLAIQCSLSYMLQETTVRQHRVNKSDPINTSNANIICMICYDGRVEYILLPCGHTTCQQCAMLLKTSAQPCPDLQSDIIRYKQNISITLLVISHFMFTLIFCFLTKLASQLAIPLSSIVSSTRITSVLYGVQLTSQLSCSW